MFCHHEITCKQDSLWYSKLTLQHVLKWTDPIQWLFVFIYLQGIKALVYSSNLKYTRKIDVLSNIFCNKNLICQLNQLYKKTPKHGLFCTSTSPKLWSSYCYSIITNHQTKLLNRILLRNASFFVVLLILCSPCHQDTDLKMEKTQTETKV